MRGNTLERWTIDKSVELYSLSEWGGNIFFAGDTGNVCVRPTPETDGHVDLFDLASSLEQRGVELPILFRFDGVIRSRIERINSAFSAAIKQYNYGNRYRLAYPVKVNQQRHVVEAVRRSGEDFQVALEVGSKPELIAVLAVHDNPGAMFLCNGYKDAEYIELALTARKLGRRSIIIVEQFYELETILEVAEKLGVEPEIGFRFKPLTRSAGKWEASSGENAKFGLSSSQMIEAVHKLKKHGKLDWVSLLHFHVGSQISSIVAIKRVLREATRMYAELRRLCPKLSLFDVGGGLGIDYDGSKSNYACSVDYSEDEYARDVVWAIGTMCDEVGIPPPEIISESGRATVAHHSVLVTAVTDVASTRVLEEPSEPAKSSHRILRDLYVVFKEMTSKSFQENFHDALGLREEFLSAFIQGGLTLEERAQAEILFRATVHRAREFSLSARFVSDELKQVDLVLRDQYFCNFSLFQSLPDSWAIDQLFPVMPIHRLHEEPTRHAILADLTCDSDGKIDRFIGKHDIERSLRLHELSADEPYYLGLFLLGAYQEILGDLHNLFGDTNVVHVELDESGRPRISEIVEGDTVKEVLSFVQYEPQNLIDRFRAAIETAVSEGRITNEDSKDLVKRFRQSLDGYTYLVK